MYFYLKFLIHFVVMQLAEPVVSCPVLLPCLPFLTACISWLSRLNENITVGMLIMELPNVAHFYVFLVKKINRYICVHVHVCFLVCAYFYYSLFLYCLKL
jgi:hypothetical protein